MDGFAWQRVAMAVACASLVSVAGCGGRNGDSTDSATAAGDVARTDSAATATAPAAAAPGTGATSGSGGSMAITGGDPEIIQVLAVVDQGEVQDGQMAQRQARNAQVKSFARELVASHTKSLQQDRQLAKSANVQLPTSGSGAAGSKDTSASASSMSGGSTGSGGVAMQLQQQHMQMMERVRSAKGASFDSAFVNAQVMGHQQVLDLLQRSQGQAQNSTLQQHMTAAVTEVQAHLERAQKLQQMLAADGGTSDSGSKAKGDTTKRD